MPRSPSADESLIDAIDAWGGPEAGRLLARFANPPARQAPAPGEPLDRLREAQHAQAVPDPARVEPTWYVRALREESNAVRRAVVAGLEEPARSTLRDALGLAESDLVPDHQPDPGAIDRARGLWTERIVGDRPTRPDDPPAIVALTTMSRTGLVRLVRLCGVAKRAFIEGDPPADPRLVAIARRDAEANRSFGRHRLTGLGATTLGRLLATADPYRVRWALQHIPYPAAKRLRAALSGPEAEHPAILAMELSLFDTARGRLGRKGGRTP